MTIAARKAFAMLPNYPGLCQAAPSLLQPRIRHPRPVHEVVAAGHYGAALGLGLAVHDDLA